MTTPDDPQYSVPVRNEQTGRTILIEARIFAATNHMGRSHTAQRAESRMRKTMVKLTNKDLTALTTWTYHRAREKEQVSEVINRTALDILDRRKQTHQGTRHNTRP